MKNQGFWTEVRAFGDLYLSLPDDEKRNIIADLQAKRATLKTAVAKEFVDKLILAFEAQIAR